MGTTTRELHAGTLGHLEKPDDLAAVNERFYERLWRRAYFVGPDRFNTWPLAQELAAGARDRLEVGPGLRPRLPVNGTHFVDLSEAALKSLAARGGITVHADARRLPYAAESFDLVCALDIIEHIADPNAAFSELARVLRPGGVLLLAVPLHPERWTSFDSIVGHARRFTADELLSTLTRHGLTIERSAPYGMQSQNSALLRFTASGFTHMPRFTIFMYNRLVLPLGLALQKPLALQQGLLETAGVNEVFLVCRRAR
jgi:SAM-dependent methyltransferase